MLVATRRLKDGVPSRNVTRQQLLTISNGNLSAKVFGENFFWRPSGKKKAPSPSFSLKRYKPPTRIFPSQLMGKHTYTDSETLQYIFTIKLLIFSFIQRKRAKGPHSCLYLPISGGGGGGGTSIPAMKQNKCCLISHSLTIHSNIYTMMSASLHRHLPTYFSAEKSAHSTC